MKWLFVFALHWRSAVRGWRRGWRSNTSRIWRGGGTFFDVPQNLIEPDWVVWCPSDALSWTDEKRAYFQRNFQRNLVAIRAEEALYRKQHKRILFRRLRKFF